MCVCLCTREWGRCKNTHPSQATDSWSDKQGGTWREESEKSESQSTLKEVHNNSEDHTDRQGGELRRGVDT